GTNLTEGDLLKARTLELLDEEKYRPTQESILKYWDNILQDNPIQTDKFLRWYYTSYKGKRPSNSQLYDDFLDCFFQEHKNEIISEEDVKNIFNSVKSLEKEIRIMRL